MKTILKVDVFPKWLRFLLLSWILNGSYFKFVSCIEENSDVIPVVYDASSVDGHFQVELAKNIFFFMKFLQGKNVKPEFFDLSSFKEKSMKECVLKLKDFKVIVSLLGDEELKQFAYTYDSELELSKIAIYTPRAISSSWKAPHSVAIKSLQMSQESGAVVLLNRVSKVGVKTLIPVLDGDSASEYDLLKSYHKISIETGMKLKFTKPILLSNPGHGDHLKELLSEHVGFNEKQLQNPNQSVSLVGQWVNMKNQLHPGVLLLARNASTLAMKIAVEKNHILLNWFSPNIVEFEEWAYNKEGSQVLNKNLFGLYTTSFLGSKGWDNPIRRQVLRELAMSTEASPKLLSSVLTFDAMTLAINQLQSNVQLPFQGISGLVEFTNKGFRSSGSYAGVSLVGEAVSANATLLQPSIWILEDIVSLSSQDARRVAVITDYDVATSSIMTKSDLLQLANTTTENNECVEHSMKIVVHDPFTQMPYHYVFNQDNLPEALVVPNHQGFGITFACNHNSSTSSEEDSNPEYSQLRLACTPGHRMSQPISCFRSHVAKRQKRDTTDQSNAVPNVQYQYSFSNDPWLKDSQQIYYAAGRQDSPPATTGAPPPPPPPPPPPKLPELRQILKAAKPFVGSCIGSTTGCSMCVLVLGRLPLGTAPTACTGPCFVGTFGSCGSLLGRVFSETTVICTELFKQGLLDVDTFMADAEFGKYMMDESPFTMQGYTLLATPLVELMKTSKRITNVVAYFAKPWAHHMKYILGRSQSTNTLGSIVHFVGYPLCNLTGRVYFAYNTFIHYYLPSIIILMSTLLPYLLTFLLILLLSTNLKHSTLLPTIERREDTNSDEKRSKRKCCTERGNYLKAIGRRT